jgi:hypothetical protein
MVDTERFQLGPHLIHTVTTVAGQLARRGDGEVSPLQVVTYLPLDVDSVGRVLEAVGEDYDIERVEEGSMCFFRFVDPEAVVDEEVDIDGGEHLADPSNLQNNLAALKSEEGWTRKVHEQHELLHIASRSDSATVELSYFLSRTDIPSARVQSILNDFDAEGYLNHEFDEENDILEYTFPPLDYPKGRHRRNLDFLDELDETDHSNRIWYLLGVFALILLGTIIAIRFYF